MADTKHLAWLREGAASWNERRVKTPFLPYLRGADLRTADLRRMNLGGADLSWSMLAETNLAGVNLSDANLMGANLVEASCVGAMLIDSNLRGADIEEANLRGAKLCGANLNGADLSGVCARSIRLDQQRNDAGRTDFTGASGLRQMQVDTMAGDTGVILTEGLVHPDRWPIWEHLEDCREVPAETYTFWRLEAA
jgi:hypothetical protein